MPSERVRNIAVGLTLIIALLVLCAGIFMLGTFATLAKGNPYKVTVLANDANGLSNGSKVDLNGVYVGSIKKIYLDGDSRKVHIELDIDHGVRIPGDVTVKIGRPAIGSPYITLMVPEKPTREDAAKHDITTDGTATIPNAETDSGPIPQSVFFAVMELSKKLTLVSDDLHELLQQRGTALVDSTNNPQHPLANISTLVERLDRTAKSIDQLIGDKSLQDHAKKMVANLDDSSQDLKKIIHDARELVPALNNVTVKISSASDKVGGAATQASALVVNANNQIVPITEKLVDVLSIFAKNAAGDFRWQAKRRAVLYRTPSYMKAWSMWLMSSRGPLTICMRWYAKFAKMAWRFIWEAGGKNNE